MGFFSREELRPPEKEYDAWLHYEFARSYRPVVDAVRALKSGAAKREDVPAMAWYLHSQFPEFPDTPWVRIPANLREARLKAHAEELGESSPAKLGVLAFTPLKEFLDDVLPEQGIDSRRNPEDNRFVVVEVNFAEEDSAIAKEFETRLKAYREELKTRFDKVVEVRRVNRDPGGKKKGRVGKARVSYEEMNLSECFFPRKRRLPVGKGSKLRQLNSYMKQLAALRLLQHYQGDWVEAEQATAPHLSPTRSEGEHSPSRKGLYTDERSWKRSEAEAGELMLRFSRYWKHNHYFVSLLEHDRFLEAFNLRWLAYGFLNVDEQPDWLRSAIESLLKNDVLVISKTKPLTS